MRIGLSCDELRNIGYAEISWLIYRWCELNAPKESEQMDGGQSGVRDATDGDIKALMFM